MSTLTDDNPLQPSVLRISPQLIPPRRTDGKFIPPHLLNDYTSESVRREQTEFEGGEGGGGPRVLRTIALCPGCQGGEADNPKGADDLRRQP